MTPPPQPPPKTILITGANRGIGYSILQALATSSPSTRYLLAARNPNDGQAARTQLLSHLKPSAPSDPVPEINVLQLDVTDPSSIAAAVTDITSHHHRLDVLINNAGIALPLNPDHSNHQETFTATFLTNVTGPALLTTALLPLLKSTSPSPRVINISSARASLALSSAGKLPPSRVMSYSVSKTALNALTVEYAKAEPGVVFAAASPGHCRTAFNGWSGTKEPEEGARVVVELVEGEYASGGFWEMGEGEKEASRVPW